MSSTGTMVRDDALVAVTAGHLVAGLHAALHRQVHLHHLQHARGEVVAGGDLRRFFSSRRFSNALRCSFEALGSLLELAVGILVFEADLEPRLARHLIEVCRRRSSAALSFAAARGDLAHEHVAHAREQVVLEDALLVAPSPCAPSRSRPSRSTARASPCRRRRA